MYRIRFHGRGGQGIKTASRILGTAFFLDGYEVQDAPRYGAERRGAPIVAYVRAAHETIQERGIIQAPDLVVVADDTLVAMPAAKVLQGIASHTVVLIRTQESDAVWRERLTAAARTLTLPVGPGDDPADMVSVGAICAGAAAQLVGVISRAALEEALRTELVGVPVPEMDNTVDHTLAAFDAMETDGGCVEPSGTPLADRYTAPAWITLPFDVADVAAPAIHAAATSVQVRTGLWRTTRPVIDYDRCKHCTWICSSFCPDNAIQVDEQQWPQVDYDHCKGCMICVAVCPTHVITAIPEAAALEEVTA